MDLNLGPHINVFPGHFYNIISGLQTEEIINQKCDLKKNTHYIKYYNKKPVWIRKIGHLIMKN